MDTSIQWPDDALFSSFAQLCHIIPQVIEGALSTVRTADTRSEGSMKVAIVHNACLRRHHSPNVPTRQLD